MEKAKKSLKFSILATKSRYNSLTFNRFFIANNQELGVETLHELLINFVISVSKKNFH